MICAHLLPLETYLKSRGIAENFRGQAWSANCREWVYFDAVLDVEALGSRFCFPPFVTIHENNDPRSGMELGFVCNQCQDGIMGVHPHNGVQTNKSVIA